MSLSYSQDERSLQAETPFGPSVLIPISLSGHDQISQPFEYCVDFVSESDDLAAADIVGQAVTIVASVADGVERPFHGLVMDFESGPVVGQGLRKYQATLRPWLSLLGYRRNSRIFQQKSVKQILEAIFGEYPDADADLSGLSGEHPAIEFLVQYEETDLAFVSRLMEDAGIYYYFEVAADSHKLIVADRRKAGPDALKARKDRAQAAFLVEVLAEDRPDELAEAYRDALSRGPRWRERIEASLARMPETARTLARLG